MSSFIPGANPQTVNTTDAYFTAFALTQGCGFVVDITTAESPANLVVFHRDEQMSTIISKYRGTMALCPAQFAASVRHVYRAIKEAKRKKGLQT
jgi:hypothetical protein